MLASRVVRRIGCDGDGDGDGYGDGDGDGMARRWASGMDAEGQVDVPFRAGVAWLRILLIAARRRRSKGRGCHCIGRWLEVNDQLGRSDRGLRVGRWWAVRKSRWR